MKILTTVSCRSGANIFIELLHFRGLLIVWDSTISGSLDRYFTARGRDGCMKDTDHPIRHLRVHDLSLIHI